MDEIGRDELLKLKRKALKAKLLGLPSPLSEEEKEAIDKWENSKKAREAKDISQYRSQYSLVVPFVPTDEEKSLLEKGEAEMYMSTDDTPIIIPPAGKLAPESTSDDAQLNFLDTTEETIVLSSHDMLKMKREELKRKGIFGTRDKQIMKPQGAFTYRTVREQWILNENVKVLFENESLLKVYQGVNIPDEMGQNMDDFDGILKQKREELRKRLLSPGRIIE